MMDSLSIRCDILVRAQSMLCKVCLLHGYEVTNYNMIHDVVVSTASATCCELLRINTAA